MSQSTRNRVSSMSPFLKLAWFIPACKSHLRTRKGSQISTNSCSRRELSWPRVRIQSKGLLIGRNRIPALLARGLFVFVRAWLSDVSWRTIPKPL